jgi:hypothetical protein
VKKIASYPILLGVLIALLIGGAIFAEATWFPWLGEALGRHKSFVQGIYFTLFFFCIWVYILWSQHRRRMFWVSFAILFLLHVAGVLFFSFRFRPLLVWESTLLGIVESYLVAALVYWLTRHSGHAHRL